MIITKAGETMTLDEAIEVLGKIGVDISKATLNRYVRDGLVTAPERGGYGRGGGRWANYSISAVAEAATAWAMLTKKTQTDEFFKELQYLRCTPEMVAQARKFALRKFYRHSKGKIRGFAPRSFLPELDLLDRFEQKSLREQELHAEFWLTKLTPGIEPTQEVVDEFYKITDEIEKLKKEVRKIPEIVTDFCVSEDMAKAEAKKFADALGVSIEESFPEEYWGSSAGSIQDALKFATVHLYVKIYGGMLLLILSLIDTE